jgi:hypothetical protein
VSKWLILLIACTGASDPAEREPAVLTPETPPPEAEAPGGRSGEKTRVVGELVTDGFDKKAHFQVDAIARVGGVDKVVISERFERAGRFRLDLPGAHREVSLVVYVDNDGDGPGTGDYRFEYEGNPIAIGESGEVDGISVLLKHPDQESSGALEGLDLSGGRSQQGGGGE